MTTDNRTNEPTPEQVEAAAKAIADCHNPGMFEKYPENWRVEARAALEAAAGVAPQAESVERANLIGRLTGSVNPLSVTCGECGSKPGKRCYGNGEMRRPHPSRETKAERELMIEAAEALAASVQPSSTVDEAALAEVIAKAGMDYNLSDRSAESYACGAPDYRSAFLARAIAEHLTGGTK